MPHSLTVSPQPDTTPRNGFELEETSDAVDNVNILKANLKAQTQAAASLDDADADIYNSSKFDAEKDKTVFRDYENACDRVKNFYLEQHTKQTVAYNLKARHAFRTQTRAEMTVWEAVEKLNTLIDESDPDTELSQIQHLLQTAEAMRRDGRPEWMQLTGFIHDLGKLLILFLDEFHCCSHRYRYLGDIGLVVNNQIGKLLFFYGAEGQWDVVGDTFPVGCGFDKAIIYPGSFKDNPDTKDPVCLRERAAFADAY